MMETEALLGKVPSRPAKWSLFIVSVSFLAFSLTFLLSSLVPFAS